MYLNSTKDILLSQFWTFSEYFFSAGRFSKLAGNVLRIGDGAAFTRKFSCYKLNFATSKIIKLAIPPHYCQYDVLVAQPNVIEIKYIKKHFFMYLSV